MVIARGALKGDTYFKIVPENSISGLPATYVLLSGTAFETDWTGAGFAAGAEATLSQVHATAADPNASDYSDTAVVLCSPTNGSDGQLLD